MREANAQVSLIHAQGELPHQRPTAPGVRPAAALHTDRRRALQATMRAAQIRALATHVKVNHDEAVTCARKLAQELLHAVYIHLARSGTAREAHTARGCRVSFRRYPPARRTARPVSDPRAMRRWGFISLRALQRRLALRGPRRPHGESNDTWHLRDIFISHPAPFSGARTAARLGPCSCAGVTRSGWSFVRSAARHGSQRGARRSARAPYARHDA